MKLIISSFFLIFAGFTQSDEAAFLDKCDLLIPVKSIGYFLEDQVREGFTYEQETAEISRLIGTVPVFHEASASKSNQNLVDLNLIFRYASYCALSTCSKQEKVSGASGFVDPATGASFHAGKFTLEVYREADGYRTLKNNEHDIKYLILKNDAAKEIVLVFRGTANFDNYIADLNLKRYRLHQMRDDERFNGGTGKCSLPNDGEGFFLRHGFIESLPIELMNQISTDLRNITEKYSEYAIIISGHSLGGALATIFATHWRIKGNKLDALYTYAQPILGSLTANNWLAKCINEDRYLRITSSNDLVPRAIQIEDNHSAKSMGHSDLVTEVYFPDPQSTENYRTCRGGNDQRCLRGVPCEKLSWNHHNNLAGFRISSTICLLSTGPGSKIGGGALRKFLEDTALTQASKLPSFIQNVDTKVDEAKGKVVDLTSKATENIQHIWNRIF